MRKTAALLLILLMVFACFGCGEAPDESARIEISGDGISSPITYSMQQMDGWGETVEQVFSAINNWPNKKFAVARGIPLESILRNAGVWDTFRQLSIVSVDGYTANFTREQIVCERWYYPGLLEDDEANAEKRGFILTLDYAIDETDFAGMEMEEMPRLVFGQEYIAEHNTIAFVENVAKIIVSNEAPSAWEAPGSFPADGSIKKGDTVKLTHDSFSLLKIFYTLDGSEPDYRSAMYNPSTYQPKLNAPIPIEKDVVIKAFVSGYGYLDSDIITFEFNIK